MPRPQKLEIRRQGLLADHIEPQQEMCIRDSLGDLGEANAEARCLAAEYLRL